MANATTSIVGVMTIILILLPGLFLNGMFLFMYLRRRRLRIPVIYFLVSLTVENFLCLCFWMPTTVLAQFGYTTPLDQASPWNGYCIFQAMLLVHYQSLHMHTYCLLAFERVLKFFKPTLHTEVFYNDIVIIMALVVMWILEFIPSLFHVMTWGTVAYMTEEFQCAYDDTQAPSRLNAMLTYVYIIPFLFTFICFLCVIGKYIHLKKNVGVTPGFEDDTVIEEDLTGYGGKSSKKADKRRRVAGDDDSDEEDKYNKLFAVYPENSKDDDDRRQKLYKYRAREWHFALLIMVIWFVFILFWLMYLVVVYMKTYSPFIVGVTNATLPTGFETAAAFLSHCTLSVLPCFYWAINSRFRRHLRLACNCFDKPKEPKKQKKVYPQPPKPSEPVYRRGPVGGPQQKNIHRGSLGEFS